MPQQPATTNAAARTALESAMGNTRLAFGVVATFSLIINLLMLTAPIYMLQIYDRVLATGHIETLVMLTLIAGGALLLMSVLDTLRSSIMIRIGCWLSERLGVVVIESGVRARLNGDPTGSQRLQDLTKLQSFIAGNGLTAFFDSPWVPVFVAIIWILHPMLGMLALASAIILLLFSIANEVLTRRPMAASNQAQSTAARQADATIRNAEVVRAMGMGPALTDRWNLTNASALDAVRRAGERSGVVVALSKFVRHFVQVLILGLGAWLVIMGELTAGGMIAASILLGRALAPVELAIGAWRNFTDARLAYGRLKEHLQHYPKEQRRITLPEPAGRLTVDSLTYMSPTSGRPILRKVSFDVSPGEAIAVIGASGAGKSTLCRFLVGLSQPSSGEVRLDGALIEHWNHEELGRHIGYLPQDVELFDGAISDNIARMRDAEDESIVRAAMLAEAHEMIMSLADGYDTTIGDRGLRLSGGQRQRVGLARAVFGSPSIIVLDEPNANLDTAGESALAMAVSQLKAQGVALIIVGHRPSTLAEADKVLLLQDGCVAMFGPREDVLEELRVISNQQHREDDETEADADGAAADVALNGREPASSGEDAAATKPTKSAAAAES